MAIRKTDKVKKVFLTTTSLALVAGTTAAIVVGVINNPQGPVIAPLPEEEKIEIILKQEFLTKFSVDGFRSLVDEKKWDREQFEENLKQLVLDSWNGKQSSTYEVVDGSPEETIPEEKPEEVLPPETETPEEVPPQKPEDPKPETPSTPEQTLELDDFEVEYIANDEESRKVLEITLTPKKFATFKFSFGDSQNPDPSKFFIEEKGKLLKIILGGPEIKPLEFFEYKDVSGLQRGYDEFMKSIDMKKNKYSEEQFKKVFENYLWKFYSGLVGFDKLWIEQNGVTYNDATSSIEIQLKNLEPEYVIYNFKDKNLQNVRYEPETKKIILTNFGFYATFKMDKNILSNINNFISQKQCTIDEVLTGEISDQFKDLLVTNLPGIKKENITELNKQDNALIFKISSNVANVALDKANGLPAIVPKIGKNESGFETAEFTLTKDKTQFYTLNNFTDVETSFNALNEQTKTLTISQLKSQLTTTLERYFYKTLKVNGQAFRKNNFVNGTPTFDETTKTITIKLKTTSAKFKYQIEEHSNVQLNDEKNAITITGLEFKE